MHTIGEANKHQAKDQLGQLDNHGEPMGAAELEAGAAEKLSTYTYTFIPRHWV